MPHAPAQGVGQLWLCAPTPGCQAGNPGCAGEGMEHSCARGPLPRREGVGGVWEWCGSVWEGATPPLYPAEPLLPMEATIGPLGLSTSPNGDFEFLPHWSTESIAVGLNVLSTSGLKHFAAQLKCLNVLST